METMYIMGDVIEMLKVIKDNPDKQNKVRVYLKNILGGNIIIRNSVTNDYDNVIPHDITQMLIPIKNDKNKLLRVLNFLENEIIEKNEDKDECEVVRDYQPLITEIIESVENGFTVYLNPETMQIDQVEESTIFDMEEFEEQNDDLLDEYEMDYMRWDNYIKFEPFTPDDYNMLMEDFIHSLDDISLANELEDILSIEESYDEFYKIINTSDINREKWENFKKKTLENNVRSQLLGELKDLEREVDIPGVSIN